MKRILGLLVLLVALSGCSTHPGADFLDTFFPGRLPSAPGYHGGVAPVQPPFPVQKPLNVGSENRQE